MVIACRGETKINVTFFLEKKSERKNVPEMRRFKDKELRIVMNIGVSYL